MVVGCGCFGVVNGKFVAILVELSISLLEIIVIEFLSADPVVFVDY